MRQKVRIKLPMLNKEGLEPSSLVDIMNGGRHGKVYPSLFLLFSVFFDSKYFAFSFKKRGW